MPDNLLRDLSDEETLSESQSFLQCGVPISNFPTQNRTRLKTSTTSPEASKTFTLLVHVGLILFYTIASIAIVEGNRCQSPKIPNGYKFWIVHWTREILMHRTAISNLSVKQSPHTYELFEYSGLAGPPSPEIDEAWRKLLEPMSIRISAEELQKNNRTSVYLPEGGGFLAWLEIFHELHCVVSRTTCDVDVTKLYCRR